MLYYIITSDEIFRLKESGWDLKIEKGSPEEFINNYFPNFNIAAALFEINNILSPLCTSSIHKQLFLKSIEVPELIINYFTDDYKTEQGLALSRIFTKDNQELIVNHFLFKLPAGNRRQGISKLIFGCLLQQYVNMGVVKITVHAALTDGGYVWAKHFFTATQKNEVIKILKSAERELDVVQFKMVERIFNNYYNVNPDGNDFPIIRWAEIPFMKEILRNSSWHGRIDLKNTEQFNNFKTYVFR